MKEPINVVYNSIIAELITYNNSKIRTETINGQQYLVNEKMLKKARISLRAKIPLKDLKIDNVICSFEELAKERQETIKNNLMSQLLFSSQEIFVFCYILHLLLNGSSEIDLSTIHMKIRQQRNLEMTNIKDCKTFYAYVAAIKRLCNKTIKIKIEKCNSNFYGVSNKAFTQPLLEISQDCFKLGNLLQLIQISNLYSDEYMPREIFNCRFNQITKFLIAYIISYEIYNYKKYKPDLEYYEVKLQTLMKKIPYFKKSGNNTNTNYYEHIKESKSKTQIISRFSSNCIEILELYKNENIISSYIITPAWTKFSVKDFGKIKFCIRLRG